MRMHDWDSAIDDFTTALRFGRDDGQPLDEAYVGLARACARRGKLKDAAEWLRKAPISMSDLRALEKDPDFRELRESRFGKDVWGS
jgi:tetratricopeptide (TPR) repeat protein